MKTIYSKAMRRFVRLLRRIYDIPLVKKQVSRVLVKYPDVHFRLLSIYQSKTRQVYAGENIDNINWLEVRDYTSILYAHGCALPKGNRTIYIYVEHTAGLDANTGLQRVTRKLSVSLSEIGEKVRFVKWCAVSKRCILLSEEERIKFARWNGPEYTDVERQIYAQDSQEGYVITPCPMIEQNWLIVPEVTHTTFHAEPVTDALIDWARDYGLVAGFIFYDAIPMRREELAREKHKHIAYMRQLIRADVIWSISQWSQKDIRDFFSIHEKADHSTMPASKVVALSGELPVEREACPKSEERIILSVGSITVHKNQVQLIKAFNQLCHNYSGFDWQLLLVGNVHPSCADFVNKSAENNKSIQIIGSVTDAELMALYMRCSFTVFPSIEEGFGLPILESLWYGKPCICANFGSMAEVAKGGGCLAVDTREPQILAEAIDKLISDATYRNTLADQSRQRQIPTWVDYAGIISDELNFITSDSFIKEHDLAEQVKSLGLDYSRPRLSLCISTYNNAKILAENLHHLFKIYPKVSDQIEVIVCDNASTDSTEKMVGKCLKINNFYYFRNVSNVGKLGNLQKAVLAAQGEYIWVIRDKDFIAENSLEKLLQVINGHPDIPLIYLNYLAVPMKKNQDNKGVRASLNSLGLVTSEGNDHVDSINKLCILNENFFTQFSTLVFRRDHALKAYSQLNYGRPYTTLLNCVPTAYYVLDNMSALDGYWVSEPAIVVATRELTQAAEMLWFLERLPELFDLARDSGVAEQALISVMDRCMPKLLEQLEKYPLVKNGMSLSRHVNLLRLMQRFKQYPEFIKKYHEILD